MQWQISYDRRQNLQVWWDMSHSQSNIQFQSHCVKELTPSCLPNLMWSWSDSELVWMLVAGTVMSIMLMFSKKITTKIWIGLNSREMREVSDDEYITTELFLVLLKKIANFLKSNKDPSLLFIQFNTHKKPRDHWFYTE